MTRLAGKRVLIMATDGFEESELFGPREILLAEGAQVFVAAPGRTPIQATVRDDPGRVIRPDLTIADARAEDFDALLLPGGVINPDTLRMHPPAVALIQAFARAAKPLGAICHGPWLLVEAGVVRGRRVACWPSIVTDLRNAGAEVVDEPAVTDGNFVTSRNPDDVVQFTEAVMRLLDSV
jgi:protease I